MSDARLRALERRWEETRDPEDEATLVRARLQTGWIDAERVALGAYCGSGVARGLLAESLEVPEHPEDWGEELWRRWGPEPVVRVALAALRALFRELPPREPSRLDLDDLVEATLRPRLEKLVRALEGWARDPGSRTRLLVRQAATPVEQAAGRFTQALARQRRAALAEGPFVDPYRALTPREQALGRAVYVARACPAVLEPGPERRSAEAARKLAAGAAFALDPVDAARGLARVGREVAAWALGHPAPAAAAARR